MAVSTIVIAALPDVERRAACPAASGPAVRRPGSRPRVDRTSASSWRPTAPSAAAVFTPNAFAAAPVKLSRANLAATSGDPRGGYGYASRDRVDERLRERRDRGRRRRRPGAGRRVRLVDALGIDTDRVLHLSTGIIGTRLPLDSVAARRHGAHADSSPMTTQRSRRSPRRCARPTPWPRSRPTSLVLPAVDGEPVTVTVTGIAKGVGMIHPNMATMLSVVLTDAAAPPEVLWDLLRPAAARTWDQLSVDGDTSTNDTVFVLASGASGAAPIAAGSPGALAFGAALEAVARDLARQQAADGEGATILITTSVTRRHGRRRRPGGRTGCRVEQPGQGRGTRQGPELGPDRRCGRERGDGIRARSSERPGWPRRGRCARAAQPAVTRPRPASHLHRRPSRVRRGTGRTTRSSTGELPVPRWTHRSSLIELDLGLGDGVGEAFGCDLTQEYVIENSEYTT